MTIALSANTPRVSYTVNQGASQTSFAVPFVFFTASTDLNVFVDGTERTFDASTSNTSQYTVSGGNGSTGSITTSVTGASGGSTVVITRDIPLSRTTDFPSSGAFEIAKLNTELDTVTAIQSDFNDFVDRTLRLQEFDSGVSMELPLLAVRKGTVLGFNATTGAAEVGPTIANVNSLSAITGNINTVAGISSNVTTVAGISSNVTTVAGISGNVTSVAGNTSNINAVAGNATNINTVASADSNVSTLAGISSDINTVAGISSNVTTVAGKASLITSAFSAGMSLVTSDFVSDVNSLAVTDVINDINTLATSDIVADLNTLATTDIVSDLNTLATTDIVSDLNTLATSDIVADINLLATNDIIADLALLATTDFVADLNTMATTTNVNNLSTVASNVAGVNSFAERYRVGSSEPSSNNDAGDLFFNTTTNELVAFNGSTFQSTSPSAANQTNINIVAGEITSSEDLGLITQSIDTSSGNNIDTVANAITNINTVAGANSNITALSASDVIADMALLATTDVIADMALLANSDVISDMNTLATSDIVSDLNTLATSDIVSDLNTLATSDIVSDINTLATSDIVSDLNTLATSDIVTDLNILGTSANVTNMATLGASGVVGNISTVAGAVTNVNTVAGSISNINTVASNVSSINDFADRYRVGSSDPSSDNDEGDLFYNSTSNTLKFFDGSSYQSLNTTGLNNIVEDTSPQLGGNLDVVTHGIVSTSNRNIAITPNGSGKVVIDGLSHPTADGSNGQFLKTNGSGVLSFATVNTDLSADSSPQLGGNLDVNGASIVSASDGHIVIDPNGSGLIKLVGSVDTTNLTMDFGSIA